MRLQDGLAIRLRPYRKLSKRGILDAPSDALAREDPSISRQHVSLHVSRSSNACGFNPVLMPSPCSTDGAKRRVSRARHQTRLRPNVISSIYHSCRNTPVVSPFVPSIKSTRLDESYRGRTAGKSYVIARPRNSEDRRREGNGRSTGNNALVDRRFA